MDAALGGIILLAGANAPALKNRPANPPYLFVARYGTACSEDLFAQCVINHLPLIEKDGLAGCGKTRPEFGKFFVIMWREPYTCPANVYDIDL